MPKTSSPKLESLLGLNLAVLCISTSGVFGKPITMAPEVTIFWRALLAAICLGLFLKLKRHPFKINNRSDLGYIFIGGLFMALHWVTFFYSMSYANIAVSIMTLHTFPAMTSILEPILLKTKFQFYHLILASLVMIGIYLIVPAVNLDSHISIAVALGLFSALTYALRNIYTRKIMPNYNGTSMMFYQLIIMSGLLLPFLFLKSSATLLTNDWPFLMGLVVVSTCIGHTLLVVNLKRYSAVTVSLISCIIPVYGILWPYLFLNEVPRAQTLVGGAFILFSFLLESYMSQRKKA